MSDLKRLTVFFGVDLSELKKGLKDAQASIKKAMGADTINASKNMGIAVAGIAASFSALAVTAIKTSTALTLEKRSFDALTGSTEKTKNLLNQLSREADKSIFDDKELRQYAKGLLTMGFNAQQVIPIIHAASEAAAATGKGTEGLDAITSALGTMKARGEITQRSMNLLITAGLPAWDILAHKIGISVPAAQAELKNGTLKSADALALLINGIGDRYKGTMAKMQGDIPTSFKRITDSLEQIGINSGQKITEAFGLDKIFQKAADTAATFSETLKTSGMQSALDGLIDPKVQAGIFALAGALILGMAPALITTGLAAAAALIPLLPFIAAGAAIGALAFVIIKNWGPIKNFFIEMFIKLKYYSFVVLYAIGDAYMWLAMTALKAIQKMTSWIPGIGTATQVAIDKLTEMQDALNNAKTNNFNNMTENIKKLATETKKTKKVIDDCEPLAPAATDYVKAVEGNAALEKAVESLKNGTKDMAGTFSDTFTDIIMGTKSATAALKDLASSMAKMFIKAGLNALIESFMPASNAAAVTPIKLAAGGYISAPTYAMVGDAGPEFVVPAAKAQAFANNINGGTGKIQIQNTVINNATGSVEASTRSEQSGDKIITSIVINAIRSNKNGLRNIIKGTK